jgi:hypothetical protein
VLCGTQTEAGEFGERMEFDERIVEQVMAAQEI